MASLIEDLIGILENEYEVYRQLLPIAEEKTKVIVKNDLISLQEITQKEQKAVDEITALEHKREAVMADIRTVLNRKSEDFNLKALIGLLGKQPKEQKALSVLHDNLSSTIRRLVDINNRNRSLIEQSLEMIEFNMNFIQSTRMSPGNHGYTKGASQFEMPNLQNGIFDAKQ